MAGWTTKIEGSNLDVSVPIAQPEAEFFAYTRREPVGVVAAIIPWNFPFLMVCWKLSPALAVGCTVVLKPAEQTSLSALYLGELIKEAGFPAGVVSIITADGQNAGSALIKHPDINKISFTGSTQIGQLTGRTNGARLVTGGERVDRTGYYVKPTIFTSEDDSLAIAREEIFGPVLVAIPFDDVDEVVLRANDSRYGLAASIWSNDLSQVQRLIPKLRDGGLPITMLKSQISLFFDTGLLV